MQPTLLIVDGTHVPAVTFGRHAGQQKACYPGKHKRHGLNVQTVCSPEGDLLRAAAPLPGATADVTAARHFDIAVTIHDPHGHRGLTATARQGHSDRTVVTRPGSNPEPAAPRATAVRPIRPRDRDRTVTPPHIKIGSTSPG